MAEFELDWGIIGYHFLTLSAAFVLAFPIGWHRNSSARRVGFRTFPIVAVASAGFILVGGYIVGDDPQGNSRLIQGLATGIGFLGGGAIVKSGFEVQGLSTAASIWNTAALGAAVAYGRYEIAIVLALFNFMVLLVLTPVGEKLKPDRGEAKGEEEDEGKDENEDEEANDE